MSTAYAARVVAVGDDGPTVRVPMLGGGQSWGPLASAVPDLEVDDQVIVMPLGESSDRLQVLARLQGRRARQGEVVGLVDRLDDIEARNAGQDSRLSGIDALNGTQNGRLTSVEGRATAVEGRATALEGRATAVEGVNTAQNGRLDATEAKANAAATATALAALDQAAVRKTGAESIGGVKTFTDQPVIPAPTLATSPVRSDDTRFVRKCCQVRLNANFALTGSASGGGDVYAGTNWAAGYDPWDMYSQVGGFSQIIVPHTGLYTVSYKTIFSNSTNTGDTIVAFVTRGSRAPGASIARMPGKFINLGSDGSPVLAWRELPLNAGDVLYWGNFSTVNVTVLAATINIPTEITVTYHGPSA